MKALDRMARIVEDRHGYAREWQGRTGGKVLPYLCTYPLEEIIYAAGILPVRVIPEGEPSALGDTYIFSGYCPNCRSCLSQGLMGKYDYASGIVLSHGCLHIRQTWDSWIRHIPTEFSHYVFVPNNLQSRGSKSLIIRELRRFKRSLESWLGREITTQSIADAVQVHNTNRRLLKQLSELRAAASPPLSGKEAMTMALASQMMDKREQNVLLRQALRGLQTGSANGHDGVRLMIVGSENNDLKLVEMIESLGSVIVVDDHCAGRRYFWADDLPVRVKGRDEEELFGIIADFYINKPLCPIKAFNTEEPRYVYLSKLAKEYGVQGVVFTTQKFCEPFGFELPPVKEMLEKDGIPTLHFELDVVNPVGPLKTRVEAFLELLSF